MLSSISHRYICAEACAASKTKGTLHTHLVALITRHLRLQSAQIVNLADCAEAPMNRDGLRSRFSAGGISVGGGAAFVLGIGEDFDGLTGVIDQLVTALAEADTPLEALQRVGQ